MPIISTWDLTSIHRPGTIRPMEPTQTPREIDTELAGQYNELYRLQDKLAMHAESAMSQAGAKFYYKGKTKVWHDMSLEEAEAVLAADIEANKDDEFGYRLMRGGHSIGNYRRTVQGLADTREALANVNKTIAALEDLYTGWSRFFLVTSSKGHIHRNMYCHTCRITTRYGWLPELSGQTETEAVDAHGPALCSVCYPSAPVEWQGGFITKAAAEKKAA
jgi:hypothetical protein